MPVATMYGINGVGKDTVANEANRRNPKLKITSESKMLMYLLGITDDYSTSVKANRAQYKQLEDTPQSVIAEVEQGTFKTFIGDLAVESNTTLVLSHLVFALHLDKSVTYLKDKNVPAWYLETGTGFVNLKAPAEVILQRRVGDTDRERTVSGIAEIEYHQSLCDEKWTRVVSLAGSTARCGVVENLVLAKATSEVEALIYE